MHFNGFPFTIHKEFVLKSSDLEKLDADSMSHWCWIRTQLKQDFIIRGALHKGVVFVFENVGQDMITVNKCCSLLFQCPTPYLKTVYPHICPGEEKIHILRRFWENARKLTFDQFSFEKYSSHL